MLKAHLRSALFLASALPLVPLASQQVDTFSSGDNRTFALVRDKVVNANGSWHGVSTLQTYAHAHPGHYIVFEHNGALYRLDDSKSLDEAERTLAPMAALDARQRELDAQQKPLAEQQRALDAQQKAAEGNPAEQGALAANRDASASSRVRSVANRVRSVSSRVRSAGLFTPALFP